MTIINGIAQIWSRGAFWAQGASVLLADAYPGRYVLGLGFGGSERRGTPPAAAMTAYLDEMDAVTSPNPAPNHVGIQVIGIKPGQTAMPYWRMLAEALISKYS